MHGCDVADVTKTIDPSRVRSAKPVGNQVRGNFT
jgi:hypothetical protein